MLRKEARLLEMAREGHFSEAQHRKCCAERWHKATNDKGEAHGCADIYAAQDVQALISRRLTRSFQWDCTRTFFSLVFFVRAKKSNSPLGAKHKNKKRKPLIKLIHQLNKRLHFTILVLYFTTTLKNHQIGEKQNDALTTTSQNPHS